ncbi:MAG: DEAD/DEAH RNA helicase [Candidatus Roizmanbacteria bacterium GW2011_GWA2_37_7]|uniref:DEAD/DEAH RNA helicase n=1 Tax=Candidatus Roizmanbacteria bacterium GW2011_GWA2_37_7 TaxID=1618481 RepID=A0A0G0JMV1_9BACT|nr:MAG: DEAD/DEAH RNA helicase [Candidatus Roizmanbacteria bacterium GW2011_GWA2_37_7]
MSRRFFRGKSYGGNTRYRKSYKDLPKIDISKYVHKALPFKESLSTEEQMCFSDLEVTPILRQNILNRGFRYLTPIQQKAIYPIMKGQDVIGIAHTGTGKTGAFLIPLIHAITQNRNKRILIMVPTRELAQQIFAEMCEFSRSMGIYAATIIGGASMYKQIQLLRRNPQFVIGTPGRLKDLIERKILKFDSFDTVILDEVDRMLDMGFIQDIRYLISLLPQKKQSLFFSATLSHNIHALIHTIAKDPIMISIKNEYITANIDQDVVHINANQNKMEVLHDLLIKKEMQKTLIFGRTKRGVERLSRDLIDRGFKVSAIHGDKTQSRRNKAIELFKKNIVNIMVATDVASRGIDIDNITHVINYDQPENYEDYIHRIGRTGRANKTGKALTFID